MNSIKSRNSSIELLRIICIIFIIAHHYFIHSGYSDVTLDTVSVGIIFEQLLSAFGKTACSIFAIITGFFMIESRNKNPIKKIFPIIVKMFIYSIVIFCTLIVTGAIQFSIIDFVKSFLPILWGNWFVVYYILAFILYPYINKLLKALSKKEFKILLIILLLIWSVIPTFSANAWEFGNLAFFIIMYAVGGYIKMYVYGQAQNNKRNLLIGLSSAILFLLSIVILNLAGVLLKKEIFISHATYFCSFNSILSVICAIFIFMFFANMRFKNKIIDQIAKSSLGIYLIHDNRLLRKVIWQKISPNINYITNPYLHAPIKIFIVFIVCLAIDQTYEMTIGRIINKTTIYIEHKIKWHNI